MIAFIGCVFVLGVIFIVGAVTLIKSAIKESPLNETYDVRIMYQGQQVGAITNAIAITNCGPHCQAIVHRFYDNTNVFHAFLVDLIITTNKLKLEK
jgi:hypothetical protein